MCSNAVRNTSCKLDLSDVGYVGVNSKRYVFMRHIKRKKVCYDITLIRFKCHYYIFKICFLLENI